MQPPRFAKIRNNNKNLALILRQYWHPSCVCLSPNPVMNIDITYCVNECRKEHHGSGA